MPFTKFTSHDIAVKSAVLGDNVLIHCMIGGEGPPLLLLHGYPQTHFMWHMIADDLASKFTVVAADLRGYGDSSKPRGSESHIEYSKKEMAADQVGLMQTIGFSEFFIVAHDRGARVAHRLAVDYPSAVKKMMLLDICPTLMMYETTDMKFAAGYWHWFFNIIPFPHAENIIMSNPQAYWNGLTSRATHSSVIHTPQAIDKYQSAFFNSETVHATCEDYRASASIDLDHDRADLTKNHKISIPALRVLWGTKGMIAKYDDVVAEWRKLCNSDLVEVTGRSMECGHFIAEESSEELLQEIFEFLSVINDDDNVDRAGTIIS